MAAHSQGLGSGLINPSGNVQIPLLGEFPADLKSEETDLSQTTIRSGVTILPIKPKQRITLHKSRQGYHTSGKWYQGQEMKELDIKKADEVIKTSVKSYMKQNSFRKVFPTYTMDLSSLPKEKPPTDRSLRYTLSGPNAFKNHAQKYKNWDRSHYSSQQQWFPNKHPEYVPVDKTHNYKKNFDSEFIEAMCKVSSLGFTRGSQRIQL